MRGKWGLVARVAFLVAVVPVLLGGCNPGDGGVVSLHPLSTDAELVSEPAIVGIWANTENKDDIWKFFQKPDAKAYTLVYSPGSDGVPARFNARLTRIGQGLYMDTVLQPGANEPKGSQLNNFLFCFHLIPVHMLWRVEIADDTLRLTTLDNERFAKAIDEKAVGIAYERVETDECSDQNFLLTAPTPGLRAFILQSWDKVFATEALELHKKPLPTTGSGLRARSQPRA